MEGGGLSPLRPPRNTAKSGRAGPRRLLPLICHAAVPVPLVFTAACACVAAQAAVCGDRARERGLGVSRRRAKGRGLRADRTARRNRILSVAGRFFESPSATAAAEGLQPLQPLPLCGCFL